MRRLLLLAVLPWCACVPESSGADGGGCPVPDASTPADAGSPPAGAELVDDATYQRLAALPGAHVMSVDQQAVEQQAADTTHAADQKTVDDFLAANASDPVVSAWATVLKDAPAADDTAVQASGPDYLHTASGADGPFTTVTMGPAAKTSGAARSIRMAADRPNRLALYQALVTGLPTDVMDLYQLVQPALADTLDDAGLTSAFGRLASNAADIAAVISTFHPALPPLRDCDDFGRGKLYDRNGFHDSSRATNCGTPSSSGIVGAMDFPLRGDVSCVKDQGSRGTCWAFAATSMMETAESVKHQVRINYSEQDLVMRTKLIWWPSWWGDNGGSVLPRMVSERYRPVYENAWSYNPSPSRVMTDNPKTISHTCNGFIEDCSDTNHQARLYCMQPLGWPCVYAGHDNPDDSDAPTSVVDVLDPNHFADSVSLTVIALAQKQGVEFGFEVMPSFDAQQNGFVTVDPNNIGKSRGGHYVHVIGYVTNQQLAMTLPNAPPAAGGGYFIIKNSWSTCAGDAGFYYLPVDYVQRFVWQIEILRDIE
ncbi:MAG: C1 family peptidase [Myxococcaceae bacterium]